MVIVSGRLKDARKKRGLSQTELANRLNIKPVNIARWENGQRNPRPSTLKRIAEILEVPVDWLLGADTIPTNHIGKVPDREQPTPHLRNLEAAGADILPPGALEVRWIPTLGMVPGGPPFEPDVVPMGMLPVPADVIRHPRAFALRVMGYSMTPIIEDGDLIACEPYEGERLAPGAIVVAMVQGESTVKLYSKKNHESLLIAISGNIKPITLQDGDFIFGVVKLVSRPPDAASAKI